MNTTTDAAIYTRGPGDEHDTRQEQEQACQVLAEREGLRVVASYRDCGPDHRARAECRRMIEALDRDDAPRHVVVWALDRLARTSEDLERCVEVCKRRQGSPCTSCKAAT